MSMTFQLSCFYHSLCQSIGPLIILVTIMFLKTLWRRWRCCWCDRPGCWPRRCWASSRGSPVHGTRSLLLTSVSDPEKILRIRIQIRPKNNFKIFEVLLFKYDFGAIIFDNFLSRSRHFKIRIRIRIQVIWKFRIRIRIQAFQNSGSGSRLLKNSGSGSGSGKNTRLRPDPKPCLFLCY